MFGVLAVTRGVRGGRGLSGETGGLSLLSDNIDCKLTELPRLFPRQEAVLAVLWGDRGGGLRQIQPQQAEHSVQCQVSKLSPVRPRSPRSLTSEPHFYYRSAGEVISSSCPGPQTQPTPDNYVTVQPRTKTRLSSPDPVDSEVSL